MSQQRQPVSVVPDRASPSLPQPLVQILDLSLIDACDRPILTAHHACSLACGPNFITTVQLETHLRGIHFPGSLVLSSTAHLARFWSSFASVGFAHCGANNKYLPVKYNSTRTRPTRYHIRHIPYIDCPHTTPTLPVAPIQGTCFDTSFRSRITITEIVQRCSSATLCPQAPT